MRSRFLLVLAVLALLGTTASAAPVSEPEPAASGTVILDQAPNPAAFVQLTVGTTSTTGSLVVGGRTVCRGTMDATPATGAVVNTVRVTCDADWRATTATVKYQIANVNTPSTWRDFGQPQTRNCPGYGQTGNGCYGTTMSDSITRTMWVRVSFQFSAVGPRGASGTSGWRAYQQGVYNDAGEPYPQVESSRGSERYVPFPAYNTQYGWTRCQEPAKNPGGTLPCWRDPNFATNVYAYYSLRGWTSPPDYYEPQVHHIHPLNFGGGNDVTNGVILEPWDHTLFTTWWRNFSPRWWCEGRLCDRPTATVTGSVTYEVGY